MRKIILLVIIFSGLLICPTAWANTTKVLDSDTDLHPQGWVAGTLQFKAGTSVTLNEYGEVISGILKYNEILYSVGNAEKNVAFAAPIPLKKLYYRGDIYPITFNNLGQVVSGYIGDDSSIFLYNKQDPIVRFAANTFLSFHVNESVDTGTIRNDTFLRPIGWQNNIRIHDAGFIKFKSGTQTTFNDKGEVISGTIAEDTKFFKSGAEIEIPADTTVKFNDKGEVL